MLWRRTRRASVMISTVLSIAVCLWIAACDSDDSDNGSSDDPCTGQMSLCGADAAAPDPSGEDAAAPDPGGDDAAAPDPGENDAAAPDAALPDAVVPDADVPDAGPPVVAPIDGEAAIGYGWIGAAQPAEARLREVVSAGARVISLRYPEEDPYAEQEVVESLDGTFIRYPTQGANYQEVAFREGMYDLYDAQIEMGGFVYLHCASSNRVGASWALYHAERRGMAPEEALERGRQAGLGSLEPMVRELLGLD